MVSATPSTPLGLRNPSWERFVSRHFWAFVREKQCVAGLSVAGPCVAGPYVATLNFWLKEPGKGRITPLNDSGDLSGVHFSRFAADIGGLVQNLFLEGTLDFLSAHPMMRNYPLFPLK